MQKLKPLIFIPLLILSTLACNTLASPSPTAEPTATVIVEAVPTLNTAKIPLTEAEVSRVTTQDAKTVFDNGTAIIVDVRSQAAYDTGHVAGAINIQLGEFESNIANINLPKDQWIITYCTWQNEHSSARAAFLLAHNGYTNVGAMLGGLEAWMNAGYPIEP